MNTLAPADIARMAADDRWLGFGYLGGRGHALDAGHTTLVAAVDQRIVDDANAAGLTYDDLFHWCNSRTGRWFADTVLLGSTDRLDRTWDQAAGWSLTPSTTPKKDYLP